MSHSHARPDALRSTTTSSIARQLETLSLSHGQVRHILWHLDLGSGEDEQAFDAVLKGFRRAGVPFADGPGPGSNVTYGFDELAELALAFVLRQQGLTLRHAAPLLVHARPQLRRLMREAALEATSGRGARVFVAVGPPVEHEGAARTTRHPAARAHAGKPGGKAMDGASGREPEAVHAAVPAHFPLEGLWLDFNLIVARGAPPRAGTPRLLGPAEALYRFSMQQDTLMRRPPVPASDIARRLLELALAAPALRRGRPRKAQTKPPAPVGGGGAP